jgi:hypothetical protein
MRTWITGLSVAAILAAAPVFAQTVKQDMKDAGSDVKGAAKDTGRATKKTARNVKHATKHTVHKASQKVANKTGGR